jgi:putative multiple sugar transport system permease protein
MNIFAADDIHFLLIIGLTGAGRSQRPIRTFVIVLIVVGIYSFITTQTVLGRHIYATGGNPEAAQLSGISVQRVTFIVFASMGMLSALSGILYSSRLQSATTTAGQLFELDAIAAAYVGGVSAAGG